MSGNVQLAALDTDMYTKEASCILSNLRNRDMRLFCQIPSIDIALINLLKSCMEYRCIYSTLIKLLGSFPYWLAARMHPAIFAAGRPPAGDGAAISGVHRHVGLLQERPGGIGAATCDIEIFPRKCQNQ